MPHSPLLWKIKRCRCKAPSNGLYHCQTGYRAVHYHSIILALSYSNRSAVTKAEGDGTSNVQAKSRMRYRR